MSIPRWEPELIEQLLAQSEPQQLMRYAQPLVGALGMDALCVTVRLHVAAHEPLVHHHSSVSAAWDKRYVAEHFINIDPTVAKCHQSCMPQPWDDDLFNEATHLREVAAEHGIDFAHGWSQSVHDHRHNSTVLNVFRRQRRVDISELYENGARVMWLCHTLHNALCEHHLANLSSTPVPHLSLRELQVIQKYDELTSAKLVAKALSMSLSTVNFHMGNVRRKTGAKTTMSALNYLRYHGLLEQPPRSGKGL
jgi:DNA-binding CsgD family transcriptional regulator